MTAALIAAAVAPTASPAQSHLHNTAVSVATQTSDSSVGLKNGSFVAAPIPIDNPTIGTGLALGGGYLFTIDPASQTSFVGLGAFRTNNGSEGAALGGKLDFAGGLWQIRAAVGYADLSYDLSVAGIPIDIEQSGAVGQLSAAYSLTKAFSVGLQLGYVESNIQNGGSRLPAQIAPDFDISTGTAAILLEYDTRDSTIYPTSGLNGTLAVGRGKVLEGVSRSFDQRTGILAGYVPVFSRGVVAGQAALCDVDRETPFYLACSLGGTDAFRGYSSTENIDNSLASLQVAFRGLIGARFGYDLFAGIGRVADSFDNLSSAPDLAAAGLGARYRLSKKFPVDFSADVAVNLDNEITTYVYIGQRF